jgi:hypothetical protein
VGGHAAYVSRPSVYGFNTSQGQCGAHSTICLSGTLMNILSAANRDMLHALSWYMTARQVALRAALSYRTQLSANDLTDMRVHYSNYFLNLLAATELFRETDTLHPNDFQVQLYSRLEVEGFPDGKANYSYIREVRNAIVHRGLDITASAHIHGDIPMILAKPTIQDQRGKRTFIAFDIYLIHVIAKCESVVGPLMLDCLNAAGIFEASVDVGGADAEYHEAVQMIDMPDDTKAMAWAATLRPEWAVDIHGSTMLKLRAALEPCDTVSFLS